MMNFLRLANRTKGWTAIELQPDGRARCASVHTPAGATRAVVDAVAFVQNQPIGRAELALLAQNVADAKRPWALVLQRNEYAMPVVAKPAVQTSETEQALRWTLASLIDFPIDEAVVSWLQIPTESYQPQRAPQLYAIAARRSAVEGPVEMFHQARLPLRAVDIRETAQRNLSARLEQPGTAVLFLSQAGDDILLTLTFRGELYLDRRIRFRFASGAEGTTAQAAGDDEETCRRVALEVMRTLDLVQRQFSFMPVRRVVLAPTPALPQLFDALAEELNVAIEPFDAEAVFDLSLVPQLREPEQLAAHLILLGAALRDATVSGTAS